MIESAVCNNCICVPICRNRTPLDLVVFCIMFDKEADLYMDLKEFSSVSIKMLGLNKTLNITRCIHTIDCKWGLD